MIKSNNVEMITNTRRDFFLYGWLTWCTKVELIVSNSIITYQRRKNLPKQLKRYEGIHVHAKFRLDLDNCQSFNQFI